MTSTFSSDDLLHETTLVPAEMVWSLERESPLVWGRAIEANPWLAQMMGGILRNGFPTASTLDAFDCPTCVRPPRHNRAFYVKHPSGAVVGIKGSEAADAELGRAFKQHVATHHHWSALDSFPLSEQRLPYAVHSREADEDVRLTTRFHERYLQHFGVLPSVPIPLAVYRCPPSIENAYLHRLSQWVSDRTMQQCRLLAQDGLAVYLYFLDHLPIRVAHVVPTGGGYWNLRPIRDATTREGWVATHGLDAKASADRFVTLAARMMALGWFPLSLASYGAGYCTSAQNVTVQGAMVDTGSMHPFERVCSDWEFFATFLTVLATLCATLRVLLYAPLPFVRFEFADPSTISVLLSEFVWFQVRTEILHSPTALDIDARLHDVLAMPSFGKLAHVTDQMNPPQADDFLSGHATPLDNRGWN